MNCIVCLERPAPTGNMCQECENTAIARYMRSLPEDRDFWYEQARSNAAEIASLRTALRQEREIRATYRELLDCYAAALAAHTKGDDDEY